MSTLHDPSIGTTRKRLGYLLSILSTALILFSGTMKIIGADFVSQSMAEIGLLDMMPYIGFLEITCVLIYWFPKTSNLGFFLLCSYVGGIIAAEIAMGMAPIIGIVVATFLYVGTMLRKPKISGLNW